MTHKKITWVDIAGAKETWMSSDDAKKWGKEAFAEEMITTGYVILKTKKYLIVGGTYDKAQGNYSDVTMIPLGVIKKIETLK